MLELRQRVNDSGSIKISVNDFVVKAYAQALMAFPAANAPWAEDRIFRFARADIGVAVAVDGGLFPPVARIAESKRLSAIAAALRDLADRARNRNLEAHEYQGSSVEVRMGKEEVRTCRYRGT